MREIVTNLLLFGVWAVLSGALVWGVHGLDLRFALSPPVVLALWLVGQLVILTPVIGFLWRERGRRTASAE
jgi:hypothetical protein